ncbi:MAG: ankyrin repeat domain-containing protein, partial [Chromatiales bacterium]|nr:ankyrin repeat domain-containing protein [Chromatiales bacterium]
MIGPHYGDWWNERPRRRRLRLALVIVPLFAVTVWGVHGAFSGPRPDPVLFEAAGRGDAGAVRAWLARGGSASARHTDGTALLHWAQEYGHRDLALLLLREGADVNAVDRDEVTALHRAADRGDAGMVARLLREGADPGAASRRHGAALHRA